MQESSPKDFICRLDLSNGLVLRPRKEKSRFGCFGTSQWAFENPTFSPVVHQGFTASIWSKFILPGHFLIVSKKSLTFAQKTVPFFRKKILKNQKYALDF
jgi:hypothetical protein